jgi:uncharacterized protein
VRILLSGASGLIGTALKESLRADGHDLRVLVRRQPARVEELRWYPGERPLDPETIAGVDAVVNLSGVGIGDRRWTQRYRREILQSRLQPTGTLVDAVVAAGSAAPAAFLSASAVGYYGDTGDAVVEESRPSGAGFLAEVCRRWEAAAARADGPSRVVLLRTGLVLSHRGGLLGRLRPLVKAGLGGRLGSGRQYQPWITLHDHVAAIRFLLANEVAGPVNLTGPAPVRQADFVAEIGRILHRPTLLPAPRFGLRLVIGDFADEGVLAGQRALPAVLQTAGFIFRHATVRTGLEWALRG